MADNITTLTDTNFNEEVKGSEALILVDFWAEWCGPCKTIAPILEEIAVQQLGKVRIAKLNIDDAPATAQEFQVMSIPTLILFKDGEVQKRVVVARSKGQLLEEIAAFL
jgi:thioredoxin 1